MPRIPLLIAVCLVVMPAHAKYGGSGMAGSAATSTYVFVSDQSTVVQTGGIAYVHWTYSIEGQFELTVDPNAGTASFAHVDANATDDSPFKRALDPNHVFNMTSLVGTVVDDATVKFTGKASDGSDVLITVTLQDNLAHLIGQTIPPPNSADFFIFNLNAVAQRKYGGGSGTAEDPYQIATLADLIALGETPSDYDKHFVLTADIDLDPSLPGRKVFDKAVVAPDVNDMNPWFDGTPFNGVFDGNGHTISHLTIVGKDFVGLFGRLESRAEVRYLGVVNVNVVGSSSSVAGLVGDNYYGTVTHCFSTGRVSGEGGVGGLVGRNSVGTVGQCYSTGAVSGTFFVGGLAGLSGGDVTACFWDTQTSGQTKSVYGTGKTTAQMHDPQTFMAAAWDFVGKADGGSDIWAEPKDAGYPILWWQLSPWPTLPTFSGGTGEPNDPYRISTAKDLNSIGYNPRLMQCHFKLVADLDLTGVPFSPIGWVSSPYGGVFDGLGHAISHLTIKGVDCVGPFGQLAPGGQVRNLGILDVNVVASGWDVGGLVGHNDGRVTECYSNGTVAGKEWVGGLVGANYGTVTQCYSTSAVTGGPGLVGANWGTVAQCYSTGAVTGHAGLVGYNGGSVTQCFWDTQTSGQTWSGDGTGKTTAQMQTAKTFLDAGWDFVGESQKGTEDIWAICEGVDYPHLAWEFVIGDFDADANTDFVDFCIFGQRWLGNDSSFWCPGGGTDLTNDAFVDFEDLMELADNWLTDISHRGER
jgi:hypothetical protein